MRHRRLAILLGITFCGIVTLQLFLAVIDQKTFTMVEYTNSTTASMSSLFGMVPRSPSNVIVNVVEDYHPSVVKLRNKKYLVSTDKRFNQLTFWSSDFHISPIADIKEILTPYSVKIIDKSLSGHCHLTNTCQQNLKVITIG